MSDFLHGVVDVCVCVKRRFIRENIGKINIEIVVKNKKKGKEGEDKEDKKRRKKMGEIGMSKRK